jgi:CBS domain containing-hemolysin-like protein
MAVLLCFSALFSSAETAFFSLTRSDLRLLREDGTVLSALAARLRVNPRRLLVSMLLGNLAANLGLFGVSVFLAEEAGRRGDRLLALAMGPGVLLAFILLGEFLPKGFALHRPRFTARLVAAPIFLIEYAIFPVRLLLDRTVAGLSRLIVGGGHTGPTVTSDELKAFVRLSGATGSLAGDERQMVEDVIEIGRMRVREVLVPRVDMVGIDLSEGKDALLDLARRERVSKVVIYEGSRDRVRGYVDVKDLLYRPDVPLPEMVRTMPAVPETKTAESLLAEFRDTGAALALVLDEYGGTEGIVTPEDLVEEVVGEIADEYDEEEGLVRRIAPGVLIVSGDMTLRDWEERTDRPLTPGKYDTIGGYVMEALDRIPRSGDVVEASGARFTALRVRRGRVMSVLADLAAGGGDA